jgi:DNA polymerase III epsilon subunit-like protein
LTGYTRVHGYTKEVLARHGHFPQEVYRKFREYAGQDFPIVAFNLSFDWDRVLLPEWRRLGIDRIGSEGFCAYRLAERLLDPCPAGNCKLQTLRQYYNLSGGQGHTALSDVETTIDLLQKVLRPLAEERGIRTWEGLRELARTKFYPSKIPFGKFKGRYYAAAKTDSELREWLEWLAASSGDRAGMGKWYLHQLGYTAVPKPRSKAPTIPIGTKSELEDPSPRSSEDLNPTSLKKDTKPGCCSWILLAFFLYSCFVLIKGCSQAGANRKADQRRTHESKKEKPKPYQKPPIRDSTAAPRLSFETIVPPATIPTGGRSWHQKDGRVKEIKVIEIDYNSLTITFQHPDGSTFPNFKISSLNEVDQIFLLGTERVKALKGK